MKYKLIYTFSFLVLCYIWIVPNYMIGRSDEVVGTDIIDSTGVSSPSDSTYVESRPTIVYIEKEESILGTSNEIITLIIGLGNIITLYYQFKKR